MEFCSLLLYPLVPVQEGFPRLAGFCEISISMKSGPVVRVRTPHTQGHGRQEQGHQHQGFPLESPECEVAAGDMLSDEFGARVDMSA